MEEQLEGTVLWFDAARGYGFIRCHWSGEELFCHFSHIEMKGYRRLEKGQRVLFEIGNCTKGRRQAVRIQPAVVLEEKPA